MSGERNMNINEYIETIQSHFSQFDTDNWDGEGSKAISQKTIDQTIKFLVEFDKQTKLNSIDVGLPSTGPGCDNELEPYWDVDNGFQTVLSIGEEKTALSAEYNDKYLLELETDNELIVPLLISYLKYCVKKEEE